jgi:hypothetical protein
MKQTVIEWLIQELKENNLLTFDEWKDIFQQAKEMEKEQIKEGYIMALLDGDAKIRKEAEQYYNETFKSE